MIRAIHNSGKYGGPASRALHHLLLEEGTSCWGRLSLEVGEEDRGLKKRRRTEHRRDSNARRARDRKFGRRHEFILGIIMNVVIILGVRCGGCCGGGGGIIGGPS